MTTIRANCTHQAGLAAALAAAVMLGTIVGPAWATACNVSVATTDPWPAMLYPSAFVDGSGDVSVADATADSAHLKGQAFAYSTILEEPGWVEGEASAYALAESKRKDLVTIANGLSGHITGVYTWQMWGICQSSAEDNDDFGDGTILCQGMDDNFQTREIEAESEASGSPQHNPPPAGCVWELTPGVFSLPDTTALVHSAQFTFYGKVEATGYKDGTGGGWGQGELFWSTISFMASAYCP